MPGGDALRKAEEALRGLVLRELREDFGLREGAWAESIVRDWMDDAGNAAWRLDALAEVQPDAKRILDMACGCGTAVFGGLLRGLDMHGVDPNPEKHAFIALKAEARGYPSGWLGRFREGYGEALPYADDEFDAVMSYQTLEHVRDTYRAIAEMIRVTRPGGTVDIRCPDYRGTFEGHYLLPWPPLLPKPLARIYLALLGRPAKGLDGIVYTTRPGILRMLRRLERSRPGLRLEVVDGARRRFMRRLGERGWPAWAWLYPPYRLTQWARNLFRREMEVSLFVRVSAKPGSGAPK